VFAFGLLFQSSRGHPLDHSSPDEHEEELGACFGPVVPLWEDGKKRLMHLSTISPLGKNIYYFMSSFDFFIHSPYLFIFIIYIYILFYVLFCFITEKIKYNFVYLSLVSCTFELACYRQLSSVGVDFTPHHRSS
jgi:hypothetical protein